MKNTSLLVSAMNNAKAIMTSKAARRNTRYILVNTYRVLMFLMLVTADICLRAVIYFIRNFVLTAEVSVIILETFYSCKFYNVNVKLTLLKYKKLKTL